MMTALPLIIDTDPGLGEPGSVIDDGLAIALALASPEIEVVGLTVVNGNVQASTGYALSQRLLRILGRAEVSLHLGASRPLRQDMARVRELFGGPDASMRAPENHSDTDTPTDATEWLIKQVARRPGEITIAAIGPLTNIAEAIQRDPSFAVNVREIVVMAGNATGSVSNGVEVLADFNVVVDPDAAAIVLDSGASIRLIGIDQTSRVLLSREDAQRLRVDSDTGRSAWLADFVDAWVARGHDDGVGAGDPFCLLHDPLVIAAIANPGLFVFVNVAATVDVRAGEIRLAESAGSSSIRAAIDVDVGAFRALFFERLSRL